MKDEDIVNIFTYHKPFGNQGDRYDQLRRSGRSLAEAINAYCPESREKSIAITQLQSAIQFANAAIAINEKEPSDAG